MYHILFLLSFIVAYFIGSNVCHEHNIEYIYQTRYRGPDGNNNVVIMEQKGSMRDAFDAVRDAIAVGRGKSMNPNIGITEPRKKQLKQSDPRLGGRRDIAPHECCQYNNDDAYQ